MFWVGEEIYEKEKVAFRGELHKKCLSKQIKLTVMFIFNIHLIMETVAFLKM